MEIIDIDNLKKIELNILNEIDEICQSNHICYSLCAGTLLGAVRHQGFIPWDDDVDIMMPRPDFNKFVKYCKNNDTFFNLVACETEKKYADIMAKAYDPTTIVYANDKNTNRFDIGVWIDIFPIDGIGDTEEEALKNFRSTAFLRSLLIAKNWIKFKKSSTHSWYIEPIRFCFFLLSRAISSETIIRAIRKKYSNLTFETQRYSGCLYGAYREKEILSTDVFKNFRKIKFENGEFYCIEKYNEYLSSLYGEYMQLPPEEKRYTHHEFEAYYRDAQDTSTMSSENMT